MVYIVKRCPECNQEYHVHLDAKGKIKKITGACEHIKVSTLAHRKRDVHVVNVDELDKMVSDEYEKSKKGIQW